MRATYALVSGFFAVFLAGCTSSPAKPSATSTKPALTEPAALKIVAANRAARERLPDDASDELLRQIYTGPHLAGMLSAYKIGRSETESGIKRDSDQPKEAIDGVYIPRQPAPDWFLSRLTYSSKQSQESGLLLFVKQDGHYKAQYAIAVHAAKNLQEFDAAVKNVGLATVVPRARAGLAPEDLRAEHAALLNRRLRGERGASQGRFKQDPDTADLYADSCTGEGHRSALHVGFRGGCTWVPRNDPTHALQAANGDTYMWYSLTLEQEYIKSENTSGSAYYNPGDWLKHLGRDRFYNRYFATYVFQIIARVPKEGSPIEVIGWDVRPLATAGT